ncbi:sugar ABC transporter substrate-binding protein [Aeromonas veronii]|jgi:glucose/mannose transport system substrate-binding protein|uniref:Probable sugar-binding periplasmic protein n=1 Tax=Aeromonas veronii TaxID=654 RepID=A0AAN1QBP4_AERVE|nr:MULTISPECIES: ABC transporter substrate-binding protein [Aeromonas]AXV21339.1 sugar ABC transporter substrate-binding protein [Aeromonas veronii]AYV35444.1 carbohydrate ABC transporter substrate-binding protein [Aeromonas veronii]EKP0295867.1 carbohydrate ABC transporter substrate-binding protein [Aeromonas veronii]MBL0447069.1 carbohydrate ABC transporter substrate-binding protein [Aeromonas veronii]MCX0444922.1 ABC transporter substrate-binding protein [Aeromonas veronii]
MKWLSFSVIALLSAPVAASQVEVLHWWTSGGEAKAVEVLKSEWTKQGNQWNDFAVQGGGGKSAMTVLKSRALAANPPEAAHLKGYELKEWAGLGFLRDLSPMAEHLGWYSQMPPMVRATLSQNGALMAVPTGIHRVNWLWLNRKIFERNKLTPPTDWAQFVTVADQLKKRGITPLAIGNEPWQLAVLFETVALGEGGKEFYRKAFLEQDSATLTGPDMVRVLTRFQQLRAYVPQKYAGLKWHQATNLLESGGAAMQVMGDWVKGELSAGNYRPGEDIACLPSPGSAGLFSYNLDSIAMFKQRDPAQLQAQGDLAQLLMTPQFQEEFNRVKGSIPALTNPDMSKFDRCAVRSYQDFLLAEKQDNLLPSMAEGMATPTNMRQAILDVLSNFFNDPKANPEQTALHLERAMRSTR